ncbi:MAG: hypothetical protein HQL51_08055 [Magnetococcales bacterium]|nr:hypothetical protein [Magnetococcales bacterium]
MLSSSGLLRLRNAVLHQAYGDSPTLARLAEDADPGLRNIATALVRSAPRIAEAEARIASGDLHPLGIAKEISAAVEKINALREDPKYARQAIPHRDEWLNVVRLDSLWTGDAAALRGQAKDWFQGKLEAEGVSNPQGRGKVLEFHNPHLGARVALSAGDVNKFTSSMGGGECGAAHERDSGAPRLGQRGAFCTFWRGRERARKR